MSNKFIKKSKEYVVAHKAEFIIAGVSLAVIAGGVIVAKYRTAELSKIIHVKDMRIDYFEKLCKAQGLRIDELVELCDKKDAVFKVMISDGLRHGSSIAGRHMANRKKYLLRKVS